MKLSRKRRRELRRLRQDAQELLDQQRVVLEHAGGVLHSAGRQAKRLSDEHLVPRIDETLETVRPAFDRSVASARRAVQRLRIISAPLVTRALMRTLRTLDQFESRDAADQLRRFGERSGYLKPKKRRVGRWFALSVGVTAAVGVGYAIWQAFRTDDDLWVAPEEN